MNGNERSYLSGKEQPSLIGIGEERPGVSGSGTPSEYLSQRGAIHLARRLQAHWSREGSVAARFWAVPIDERFPKVGSYQLYKVECNFVNGLPPDWPLNTRS